MFFAVEQFALSYVVAGEIGISWRKSEKSSFSSQAEHELAATPLEHALWLMTNCNT
jgi:hypothetical protein